jgi:Ca2+-transporting ATPase
LLYRVEEIPYFGLPSSRALWTHNDHMVHTTIVFNSFVLCQLFNEVSSRKLGNGNMTVTKMILIFQDLNIFKGLMTNTIFLAVMGFTLFVQFLIVQFGGDFSQTRELSLEQWLACAAIGAASIPYGKKTRIFH